MKRVLNVIVVEWPDRPEKLRSEGIEATCDCGADVLIPCAVGTRVIATIGMGIVFDNVRRTGNEIPSEVMCPRCVRTYELEQTVTHS